MDDGVSLAYTLSTPDGPAPPGAGPEWWSCSRSRARAARRSGVDDFVDAGYAVLAYDAIGSGALYGGEITLAGPREVADLGVPGIAGASQPDVGDEDRRLGHLVRRRPDLEHALAAGVPFGSEVVEHRSSLYDALWPQKAARSGIVAGFAASVAARSPLIASLRDAAVQARTPPRSGNWTPSARRCRRSARSRHPSTTSRAGSSSSTSPRRPRRSRVSAARRSSTPANSGTRRRRSRPRQRLRPFHRGSPGSTASSRGRRTASRRSPS